MARQPDFGRHGGDLIADTTSVTAPAGGWTTVQIIEATVFSTLTATNLTFTGGLAAATFPAGLTIHGNFTVIKLASGAVLAYDGAPTSA